MSRHNIFQLVELNTKRETKRMAEASRVKMVLVNDLSP